MLPATHRDSPTHPHACGEDCSQVGHRAIVERPTPTHVGKTAGPWPYRIGRDSPPRMWGRPIEEPGLVPLNHRLTPTHVGKTGSGPGIGKPFCQRPTPTHVGKTCHPPGGGCRESTHPHACGEDAVSLALVTAARVDPPPRMWGRRRYRWKPLSEVETYPHECGEDGSSKRWIPGRPTPTHVGSMTRKD